MGIRFRKTFRIGKVFRINLSKRGVGWSAYIPGMGLGVGQSPPQVRWTSRRPVAPSRAPAPWETLATAIQTVAWRFLLGLMAIVLFFLVAVLWP